MAAPARRYKQFLGSLEPQVRRAFEQSIERIIARSSVGDLTDAIQDPAVINAMRMLREMPWMAEEIAASAALDNVMAASGVTSSSFAEMAEAIRDAFKASGEFYMAAEVPSRYGMNFRMTNTRVNAWLDRASSQLITGDLIPEQRRAVQIALSNGVERGRGPRSVALDIVGRINSTGRRAGGVIGLSEPQAEAYIRAAGELGGLDSNYFTRTRRDKRYDAMVRRAIDSQTPLTDKQIETISGRYADRLLKLRGTTISRTESGMAAKAAGDEAMMQVFDEGLAEPGAVTKFWDATLDGKSRPDHAAMNNKSAKWGEAFILPDGTRMSGPHDSSAPARQLISCRCFERRVVDFSRTKL